MCTPYELISDIVQVGMKANQAYQERKSVQYQTEIAKKNARALEQDALAEKQKGIEESRLKEIEGIKELNKKRVRNAASGFDYSSGTHLLQYEDIEDETDYNSDLIKNDYDLKAKSYYSKANSYLQSANEKIRTYNSNLVQKGFYALGELKSVTDNWEKY